MIRLIIRALLHIIERIDEMSAELDALVAQVSTTVAQEGSVAGKLATAEQAVKDLAAANLKIVDLTNQLKASSDALAAALAPK